jgi:hypothetical protein
MRPFKKNFFLCLIFLNVSSCSFFNTEVISPSQIISQSKWSENDQYPSFPECEDLEPKDQKKCFESLVSELISEFLYEKNIEIEKPFDQELTLILNIDSNGNFSVEEINSTPEIRSSIPDIDEIIVESVKKFPKALPAVKTNVGVFVSTNIKIPINIIVSLIDNG